jgi:hypothetical protein
MHVRSLCLAATMTLALATTASAGPPWISIELPTNPHHASTRNATLLVRAYHHSTALKAPLTGVAEGIVDGRRVSLPLELRATNQPGVYALTTPLPSGGTWIMAITVSESSDATATALVTVDPRGRIVAIDVPSTTRDGWKVPSRVDAGDVEAALRAAHVAYGDESPESSNGLAMLIPLLLVGGVAAAARGRSRRMD